MKSLSVIGLFVNSHLFIAKIINEMYKIKPPFNVNTKAEVAAAAALKDNNFIKKSVKHNLFWAKKLKKIFEAYSIKTNEVSANFLLLNFKK